MSSIPASCPQPLLSVRGVSVDFNTENGVFRAVENLDFDVRPGKTLAIVGESGSGKSVTSMAIMRLTDYNNGRIATGQILFRDGDDREVDLTAASDERMRAIRGNDIAMIFQEPMTSLNPVFTIGDQIIEAIMLHQQLSRSAARKAARALLEKVRLPDAEQLLDRYPHQLSGGMRQRVMIAMALSCQPRLLIADEPTTALDVTIQAQILNTIRELQRDLGTAVIFITHDMGVVAEMADDVVVMLRGRKVEQGPVEEIFRAPKHPYTRALLAAVPRLGSLTGRDLPLRTPQTVLEGDTLREVGETREQDTARYDEPVLRVEKLTTRFDVGHNLFGRVTHRVHAVEEVSFDVYPGETLALVGESGSGKSTIGKTLQQLVAPTSGAVRYNGQDIFSMDAAGRQRLRQEIQYIFQDPYASLDPRKTVAFSIAEPIRTHRLLTDEAAIARRVGELLEQVGLKPEHARRYPHEFSGGQRQRVCIARALASDPKLIIADESVSALDVSIQAQILNLLMDLQKDRGLSYLFITHDMAVVEKVSHRVAVLYLGQIVELGTRRQIFESPQHAYTRKLLAAVPVAEPGRHIDTSLIEGEIPSPVRRVGDEPAIIPLVEFAPGHRVARAA
ncbi:dipeptide ABC transporter ATP-binding protein [Achromobacter xylosoxidans]|uniref:ABC transporter ATP-binding protein n=1 Tax=Alcaligenes xylosoxydans xylosoxydans TaxID=85698 RepID=UPI0006ABF7F2|nr:dipeptide ABC transporter ATP-binding protein [Achromobacter xylosoxidans]KOQ20784.1 glutathione ABC transporter ATP-binding protein [Achromobacter xylosoxidans]KOQ25219.1 glutathione ABC transporter ATP-binding protein [Achromobacter xylosoxidans]KOQ33334.1 glutathione ABC transporter ATP-binding protein [Achromobacter xylosoxidans]KOQ39993.1 glutathione ABC transporter ATP-binding protein [Achromobacter xylosoxidans]KOQ40689.1 glutathione ABC transporter ATP-binding protein [Achromobacter